MFDDNHQQPEEYSNVAVDIQLHTIFLHSLDIKPIAFHVLLHSSEEFFPATKLEFRISAIFQASVFGAYGSKVYGVRVQGLWFGIWGLG